MPYTLSDMGTLHRYSRLTRGIIKRRSFGCIRGILCIIMKLILTIREEQSNNVKTFYITVVLSFFNLILKLRFTLILSRDIYAYILFQNDSFYIDISLFFKERLKSIHLIRISTTCMYLKFSNLII